MKWFLSRLLVVETIVAGAFYAIAAALLFGDVIGRELFDAPIWGSQRSAVLLANAAALIGIGVAFALNRHIRPNILDHVVPARFERQLKFVSHLFAAAVLFYGAYLATHFVAFNRELGFTSPPLDLEIWIPQLALVYGFATAGLRSLIFAFDPDLVPDEKGPM